MKYRQCQCCSSLIYFFLRAISTLLLQYGNTEIIQRNVDIFNIKSVYIQKSALDCATFYLNRVSRREHVFSSDIKYRWFKLISICMGKIAISHTRALTYIMIQFCALNYRSSTCFSRFLPRFFILEGRRRNVFQ